MARLPTDEEVDAAVLVDDPAPGVGDENDEGLSWYTLLLKRQLVCASVGARGRRW